MLVRENLRQWYEVYRLMIDLIYSDFVGSSDRLYAKKHNPAGYPIAKG
jgi:hypothetical protein